MKLGKYVILKDKQFYSIDMRFLGNPTETAKELSSEYTLLHIRDLDIDRGKTKNLDVYDKLTYIMHVQVEIHREILSLRDLLSMNVRLVGIPGVMTDRSLYRAILINRLEDVVPEIKDVIIRDQNLIDKINKNHRIMTLGFRDPRAFLSIDT
ncbi:MAG: hypothetical protein NZ908_01105 [Candidatus Micrarchaeota archaeon]|nr:hypothetical protein [Candidatus Micrarchaeota archaeon]MCX8154509.1 hypothetical protein [Candidatus Micrarchaeota archaeon]